MCDLWGRSNYGNVRGMSQSYVHTCIQMYIQTYSYNQLHTYVTYIHMHNSTYVQTHINIMNLLSVLLDVSLGSLLIMENLVDGKLQSYEHNLCS